MFVYLLIGVIIIILSVATSNYKRNSNLTYFSVLSCTLIACFAGFRGDFTTDYYSYYSFFRQINSNFTLKEIIGRTFYQEKGFVILNKIVGFITDSPIVFIFFVSLTTIILVFFVLKKYSNMMWLSVLFFVSVGGYYDSFNILRQILASAIVFSGTRYIVERKPFRFFLLVLVASSIHRTALIMIPFYFILTLKPTKKRIAIYSCIGIISYILLPAIITFARKIFPKYSGFNMLMDGSSIKALIMPVALLIFLCFVILAQKCDFEVINNDINKISINALVFYIVFLILGTQTQIVSRVAYFFQPYICILIPNLLVNYKDTRERRIIIMVVIALLLIYPIVILSGTGYDPYYTIFDNIM